MYILLAFVCILSTFGHKCSCSGDAAFGMIVGRAIFESDCLGHLDMTEHSLPKDSKPAASRIQRLRPGAGYYASVTMTASEAITHKGQKGQGPLAQVDRVRGPRNCRVRTPMTVFFQGTPRIAFTNCVAVEPSGLIFLWIGAHCKLAMMSDATIATWSSTVATLRQRIEVAKIDEKRTRGICVFPGQATHIDKARSQRLA